MPCIMGKRKLMSLRSRLLAGVFVASIVLVLGGCQQAITGSSPNPSTSPSTPTQFSLTVAYAGVGSGTVTSAPVGINCPQTCTANFASGAQVTLTETATATSSFAGWTGSCAGATTTCTVAVNGNSSVTASFAALTTPPPQQVQLNVNETGTGTVTSVPGGVSCPQSCAANFDSGTQVTLTATPANGFSFSGWGGSCAGNTPTCVTTISTNSSITATFATTQPPPPQQVQLTVTPAGAGSGVVTSVPTGINCPQTCSADFAAGTQITLTAAAGNTYAFDGWNGLCTGTAPCTVTLNNSSSVTATFAATLQSINHIIFMLQENRSFDEYFGALRDYWRKNGYPDQPLDGLSQFNNPAGPVASIIGCDPAFPFSPSPSPEVDCKIDASSPQVPSFHIVSQCTENPSPSWNESHVDWNVNDPVSPTPTMDGFARTAADDARRDSPPLNDTNGARVMGYYTGDDLPYYYFMASNFATSDRWFSPVMSRTQLNRAYLMAGTSDGHAYPPTKAGGQLTNKTIFELLQDASIPWRIYITDDQDTPISDGSEESMFVFANSHSANFVSAKQFMTDLQNNKLPAVAAIEPGFAKGLDEHSGETPTAPSGKIQAGAAYVSTLINALMQSPYWKDSVFILSWDEIGGFYDHVPPQPMPSPDGLTPSDLRPNDICTQSTGPNCDFVFTGFRVPLIVISPFTKKNYVSHTVADYTAITKLIETRFGLPSLTRRDAAQMDMTEFFDFVNEPWLVPPTPPVQPTNLPCEYTKLQ
jgi:phospholipase C